MMGQSHILEAFAAAVSDPNMPEAVLILKKYLSVSPEFVSELAQHAQGLGVAHKVYWLEESAYAEIPIQYAMADVVVNYPEQDALPVSLYEATASKCAVISADLPAYKGLFEDAILMVPPGQPESLSRAIKSCLVEEPQQRKTRVEKAFAKSISFGDQNKNLEQLLGAFECLISKEGGRAGK
jgi:glycosyltransferase involved in cell wall biosynthesis